jgi:hypothetical protein
MRKFNRYLNEDIQLTLEYHDELNPTIWEENATMKPKVLDRLLQIGEMWAEFSRIPESAVRDITLTGGNANYNYTPYSDLDVHILVDISAIPVDKEFLVDYFLDKKALWAYKHPGLTVMGYPVELYAQDYREQVASHQGVFSLKKNKWIYKPNIENHPDFHNDSALKLKIEEYIKTIEKILTEPGDHTQEIKSLKEKFRTMRSAGIHRAGEFSNENLIFKDIRNRGYFDRLNKYLEQQRVQQLSLY